MNDLKFAAAEYLLDTYCDAVAVGVLDFENHTSDIFEFVDGPLGVDGKDILYDLASLTKPLTNSFIHIANDIKDPNLELLINHKASLPSWGLLSRGNWKEQILNYEIKESETLYSDFSAIRYMLEIQKSDEKYKDYWSQLKGFYPGEIHHWLNLPRDMFYLQYGYFQGKPNFGKVHDPNAQNIKEFLPHAGLFGTIDALCRSLIEFDRRFSLLEKMNIDSDSRFVNGFDTVANPSSTLAGNGCSTRTFGHLGFTGSSFWIDPKLKLGHVILTNATKHYWFDKERLNEFRREVGQIVWSGK